MRNALSVDLEDWYHICGINNQHWVDQWYKYINRLESNVDKILRMLEKHQIKATFFVVGYIAEKRPGLIKKIALAGHEIASHGYFHKRIFDMTPQEFEKDLIMSKIAIEQASGTKVKGYRAPEWSMRKGQEWVFDILKKNGFEYDASVNPLSHITGKTFGFYPHFINTKNGKIWEYPLSTCRAFWERLPFSGGLPLRITPYSVIIENTRYLNKRGIPVMFYIHPWEFDEKRVQIDLPINRKFMHYFNCKNAPQKIENLFSQFKFSTVENSLNQYLSPIAEKNSIIMYHYYGKNKMYGKSLWQLVIWSSVIYIFLFIIAVGNGIVAIGLLIAFLSVFYWPWGMIFELGEKIKHESK